MRLCDNHAMTADGLAPLTRRIVDLLESHGVAHGLLRHAPVLTSEEALNCLSALRFGVQQRLVEGFEIAAINKALLLSQPGHLQRFARERLGPEERDHRRASLLREALGCEP